MGPFWIFEAMLAPPTPEEDRQAAREDAAWKSGFVAAGILSALILGVAFLCQHASIMWK